MYRSGDGGQTFVKAKVPGARGQGDWSEIKYGLKDPNTGVRPYFAACSWPLNATTPKMFISRDKGANWFPVSLPIASGSIAVTIFDNRLSVAPSAVDPKVVYIEWGDDNITGTVKMWKGTQQGNSNNFAWTDITGNTPTGPGQSFYDLHLRAAPFTGKDGVMKDILYAGTLGVGASFGDGVWFDISRTYSGDDAFHTDQHDLNFDPFNPNELIVGCDGGVYGLTLDAANFDPKLEGKNWKVDGLLNKTLGITQIYFADFHPTDPTIMLGGAQDNSTPAALGDLDSWTNVGVGDGAGCAINPTDPLNQYSCDQEYFYIFRTKDLWQSAEEVDLFTLDFPSAIQFYLFENPPFIGQIAHDPAQNSMYIASEYLWRFNSDSNTWEGDLGGKPLAGGGGRIKAITLAPSDRNRIYTGSNDGQLWMSEDGGATFKRLGFSSLPNRAITGINVHPTNPNDILVTFGGSGAGQLYQCKDTSAKTPKFDYKGGYGITRLPDITADDVTRDPLNPDTNWFVGTDVGVFYTPSAGADWGNATASYGLPNVQISTLKAIPATGYVMASTFGRGFWRLDISNGFSVPIADSIGISLSTTNFQRQGRTIGAKLTITNDRDVNDNGIQFDTMTVTVGAKSVSAQPIPLNVGAIPGIQNGNHYYVTKNISFPLIGKSGDKATLTVTGTLSNDGPRSYTRSVDFVIP